MTEPLEVGIGIEARFWKVKASAGELAAGPAAMGATKAATVAAIAMVNFMLIDGNVNRNS